MPESTLKKKIKELSPQWGDYHNWIKEEIEKRVFKIIDDAHDDIFPLPKGDIRINPYSGERSLITHDLGDWLRLINKLRDLFGHKMSWEKENGGEK